MALSDKYIKINGERLYLDTEKLAKGRLVLITDEQCERCGTPMWDNATLNGKMWVHCNHCGETYQIKNH